MSFCNIYEQKSMRDLMGETLRPGGFDLTEMALWFCKVSPADAVLDIGCGMGATSAYLSRHYGISVVGIDPSEKMLQLARENHPTGTFVHGSGENIPFENNTFNYAFAECTLSLMSDIKSVISESHRVLKSGGWLAISDVYARRPDELKGLSGYNFNSCLRGLHDLEALKAMLKSEGFEVLMLEDHSDRLKEIMVKIIFTYGSMSAFWGNVANQEDSTSCCFQENLMRCKPGYFMLIAKKGDV